MDTSVTQSLIAWGEGDKGALDDAMPVIYAALRDLAARYMGRERPDHTLTPTALVHEAYLRLVDQRRVDWRNRAHFLGIAANMMRRILVSHARDRVAAKRGGAQDRVSLSMVGGGTEPEVDVIGLNDALERLAERDERKARVVELRFFGGLTIEETATVLEISAATVEREWTFARAWLLDALEGPGGS